MFKERPVWTYAPRMHYHTPAQLEAKCRWLKWMWFILPVSLALGRGDFWTDPYDPTHPAFQWAPVIVILVWSIGGLAVYFAIRWTLGRKRLQFLPGPVPQGAGADGASDRQRFPKSLPQ